MGRYLTSGMNILPTRNPRVILSVFCHLTLYYYLFICFQARLAILFFFLIVVGALQCKQMSWLRTLSQFVASCEFSSTVVCWCAVSCDCHFPISHLKCSLQKLAVNWLPVLQQFFSIRNHNLMLYFCREGEPFSHLGSSCL